MEFERRIHGYVYGEDSEEGSDNENQDELIGDNDQYWRKYDEYVQYENKYRKVCDEIYELSEEHRKLYNKPLSNKFIKKYMTYRL